MSNYQRKLINIRNEWEKPLQHIPLVQTLVHSGFFFQKTYIREDIKALELEYQSLSREIIKDFGSQKFQNDREETILASIAPK